MICRRSMFLDNWHRDTILSSGTFDTPRIDLKSTLYKDNSSSRASGIYSLPFTPSPASLLIRNRDTPALYSISILVRCRDFWNLHVFTGEVREERATDNLAKKKSTERKNNNKKKIMTHLLGIVVQTFPVQKPSDLRRRSWAKGHAVYVVLFLST